MAEEEEKIRKENEGTQTLLPVLAQTIERYLAEISNYPVLSREDEYKLATRYKEKGDLEAARKLIISNLRFVVKIANEYRNYGLNILDMIQEGNIGLMKAVTKFDPTKGYRLISYAVWWIRAYIQNYIIKNWSLVKMGTTEAQRKLFYKLRSTKRKLGITDETLSPKNYKALAKKLDVTDKAIMEMEKRMTAKDLSLDTRVRENGEATHLEFLVNSSSNQQELLAKIEEDKKLKSELENALKSLDARERFIIKNRTLKDKPVTLKELGKKFNVSKERIRQIEQAALKKIREFLEEREITQ